jgi:hypothetical protein
MEDEGMPQKKHKPEEIVAKLRLSTLQERFIHTPLKESLPFTQTSKSFTWRAIQ